MTYDEAKRNSGREPVYVLEMDLDSCSLTHGVLPCTSTASASNACFNTFGTCLDTPNFTKTTKTIRFASTRIDDIQATGEAPTFPTILNVSTAPTILTPAKGLGVRSTCSITLADHTWTDEVTDPYVANRSYDPENQGTFWGRLLVRNKFYEGREIRLKTGYLEVDGSYNSNNFVTRTYFIDTISGPDAKGKVTVKGKDVLKFADRERAQLPIQSQATLSADISASTTSFDIADPNDDVKDSYDSGQTYIRIDDETMNITNLTGASSPYTLTVTRGTMPSIYTGTMNTEEHSQDATVQHCYFYDEQDIDDVVKHLTVDTAGISSAYTPLTDWQTVVDFGLQSYKFSALITEPTGVKDLLEEVTQHSILLWWDEREQEIQMDSLINRSQVGGPYDDDQHNVAESVNVARDDKGRVSQVWVAHGLRNPVLEMDELKNFESVKVSVDLDAEGANQYNQKKVRRIWSRFLPTSLGSVASEIANRLLNYYKVTKRVVTVTLDPKDDSVWTGDLVTLKTRQIQDAQGASPELGYRILQVSEELKPGDVRYKYVMETTDQDLLRIGLIGPNTLTAYSNESDANTLKYAFASPNSGTFADGTTSYQII